MNPLNAVYASEKREFAFELKFLLDPAAGEQALAWARNHLCPDPHANGSGHGSYKVNSLYLDTPRLDVYHRVGSFARCKYRLRRYGDEKAIFLERKLKSKGQVGKRRTRVPEDEIRFLARQPPLPGWPGFWFGRRLLARDLSPRCQITYERVAMVGLSATGPVRLTLDQHVRSFATTDWRVTEAGDWISILADQWILELKFRSELPPVFKHLMDQLALTPQSVSKYRLSVQAFQWAEAVAPGRNGHPQDPDSLSPAPADPPASLSSEETNP